MRYELTDDEWAAIKPMLPNKPCGDRRHSDARIAENGFAARRSVSNLPK